MAVELVADSRCLLGECPLWDPDAGAFRWLDLAEPALHSWSPEGGRTVQTLPLPAPLGGLVRMGRGVGILSRDGVHAPDGELLAPIVLPTAEALPNDAAVDRTGRLWIATADQEETAATASLLRVDGGMAVPVDGPAVVANGPAFSPSGSTAYWCDTLAGRVVAVDPCGGAKPENLYCLPAEQGYPDGLTVAADGSLFVALWGGGAVLRLAADGRLLDRIVVPAPLVTSVTFGGPGLDVLLITTARWQLDDEDLGRHPFSGGAFTWHADVVGLPEAPWSPSV